MNAVGVDEGASPALATQTSKPSSLEALSVQERLKDLSPTLPTLSALGTFGRLSAVVKASGSVNAEKIPPSR